MDNHQPLFPSPVMHTYQAFALLMIALLGFFVIGPLLGALIAVAISGVSVDELKMVLNNPMNAGGRSLILALQAGATIGMAGLPYLYARYKYHLDGRFYNMATMDIKAAILAMLITFTFMIFNSVVIEWNMELTFPSFLQGFEKWARQTEEAATQMVAFLTDFESAGTLLMMLIIMAVLPAIAEEYVFRGLIQRKLELAMTNIHLAIWISAILFSAIHMQFFGFFPRLLLGALFGYLYVWSRNLWIPIAAHFFNNAFMLIMIYLYKSGSIGYDIENSEAPSLVTVAIFAIITFALVYYFRKAFAKQADGEMAKNI